MEEKVVKIISEMVEYLSVSQMKKLQAIVLISKGDSGIIKW